MHARDNVYTPPEAPRSCTFYLTCENESTPSRDRNHMYANKSNDDEIFIAEPQPTCHKAVDPISLCQNQTSHELLSISVRMQSSLKTLTC